MKQIFIDLEEKIHSLQLLTKDDNEKFIFGICRMLIFEKIGQLEQTDNANISEISDEEIEKEARQYTFDEYQKVVDYEKYDTYSDFINGAKWYREQLKKK